MSDAQLAKLPSKIIELARARTPARLLVGRAGTSYRSATQLELRADHAAARDAVYAEFDLVRDLGAQLVDELQIFQVTTQAQSRSEYLLRPDLGRRLSAESTALVAQRCPP